MRRFPKGEPQDETPPQIEIPQTLSDRLKSSFGATQVSKMDERQLKDYALALFRDNTRLMEENRQIKAAGFLTRLRWAAHRTLFSGTVRMVAFALVLMIFGVVYAVSTRYDTVNVAGGSFFVLDRWTGEIEHVNWQRRKPVR